MGLKISFLIFFLLCTKFVLAQSDIQWINNDSIRFGVGLVRSEMQPNGTYSDPKFVVNIKLDEKKRKQIKLISKENWLTLLLNNNTDWAANLLLYYLYSKNAIKFTNTIKSKEKWKELGQQSQDIEYWTNFLLTLSPSAN